MRSRTLSNVLTVVTAGSLVASSPAAHKHHKHPHSVEGHAADNVKTVNMPGPTIVAFELNGKPIGEDEVCQGIKEGSLKWVEEKDAPLSCPAKGVSVSPSSKNVKETPQKQEVPVVEVQPKADTKFAEQPKRVDKVQDVTHMTAALEKVKSSQSTSGPTISGPTTQGNQHPSGTDSAKILSPAKLTPSEMLAPPSTAKSVADSFNKAEGLDRKFPDGTIDCSTFPQQYGPIKIDWAGLGGWSGIQYVTIEGNTVSHIDTAIPGGEGCKKGAMCSYACPPGYQKSQWPSTQGATGQSVGGLRCDNGGKLRLTNPQLSRKLCIPGTGATKVENRLSSNAAICRTDYPGELIPSLPSIPD